MAIRIKNAVFLHIPKTGGTWVTHYFRETDMVIEETALAHCNGTALSNSQFPKLDDLAFCFVRHPLTWFRSYWQCKQVIPDRRGGYLDEIVDEPFSRFIDKIIEEKPGYLTDFYRWYTAYSRFIGKQENLREDLDMCLKYLRIPYDRGYLFKKEIVNTVHSSEKYTIDQALSIMESEKEIIDAYGYDYIPLEVI